VNRSIAPTGALFLGAPADDTRALARALGATLEALPATAAVGRDGGAGWDWAEDLDSWRTDAKAGATVDRVVVCLWAPRAARPLLDTEPDAWIAEAEWGIAQGYAALDVACARCRDGGAVVAVVERPAALDAVGHATTIAVADGMLALVRSLASAHGGRGVRVNVVTTELSTAPPVLLGAAPPLASFPGRAEHEVAGAVRLLLSADAAGVTGTALRADCGRAW
jgi:hypothetical protein